jgi:hypothetical protein
MYVDVARGGTLRHNRQTVVEPGLRALSSARRGLELKHYQLLESETDA